MMVGQGRPKTSRTKRIPLGHGWRDAGWHCALLFSLWFLIISTAEAGDSIRVRVAWGGPVARVWHGSVEISEGTLGNLCPLGIQADEPGSMWIDGRTVIVQERSPRLYDGFDVQIHGPVDRAKLRVRMKAVDDKKQPAAIEIPLSDVLGNLVPTDLDEQGTKLLIRRSPGDVLDVKFDRRHLIFQPGEFFSIQIRPNWLPEGSGGKRRLKVQLQPARNSGDVISTQDLPVQPRITLPLSVPRNEGVYDLILSVVETPNLLRAMGSGSLRLKSKVVLASRRIQLVVLEPHPSGTPLEKKELQVVEEIDPANPKWWERFTKPPASLSKLSLGKWSRLWQGPLGSGDMTTHNHSLGRLAQLAQSKSDDDVTWEAYTVPIKDVGKPHVLEVEYPSDMPQQLGISVFEPDASGSIMPIQLDSGVNVAKEIIAPDKTSPQMLRHRLIFWPHTEAPLVLITNRSSTRPAVYGKIRVLSGWDRLPAQAASENRSGRVLGAYFDRPLFAESFCATEEHDAWLQRSLDDWITFYQGGTRLVEYLRHVGMNGMMISAFCEGSALYPSQLIQPTPRYDKGPFFNSGQDPTRKDVLEMLFRLFDRDKMRLIPAMEFASPLPELEAILRQAGPESQGIQLIGPEGLTWEQVYRPHQRMAPYYNLLDPRVQNAMLRVVREIINNYAREHESFAGLAIQLASYGYAQLPGPDWGLDDATIARFERETGIRVPTAAGPKRYAQRYAFLSGPGRQAWLKWRSDNLGRFYHRLQAEIRSARPDARLYLTTANLLTGPHWQQRLQPTLSQPVTMNELLLEAGIDTTQFRHPDSPVLVRANRVTLPHSPDTGATDLALQELNHSSASHAVQSHRVGLYFHEPRDLRLKSFDAKSPFKPCYAMLHTQLEPSGYQNRQRFVRELAMNDSLAIFDGGGLLPMGQQDALADLAATYRQLPPVAMQRVTTLTNGQSIQPITVRHATYSGKTYVYAVNDSPVPVALSVQVAAGPQCRLEPLVNDRRSGKLIHNNNKRYWRVELAPYDLVGARLSEPGIAFSSPKVSMPDEIRNALATHISDLGARLGDLRVHSSLDSLSNAGFEQPAGENGTIVGWKTESPEGTAVELQRDTKRSASPQVVRLISTHGTNVSLLSNPFTPPSTGRLTMLLWLKVPNRQKQPAVELVFEGRLNGEPFSRRGILGRSIDNHPAKPIYEEWSQFQFPVVDLPLEGLTDFQVGLRVHGEGEVWADNVELRHIEFTPDEFRQLSRMISAAQTKLETNEISDCLRLLEGYWPRFLERNVPARTNMARHVPPNAKTTPKKTPERTSSKGFLDRVRKWW